MNSFMSWVGGKKALRDAVLARFPPYSERYREVFGGAGWVLFRKPPGMDFEVYNDFNGNLANLYRCVRDKPNIRIEEISRINNLAQRYDGGCQYAELLISNYDTSERARSVRQLSLFDDETDNLEV